MLLSVLVMRLDSILLYTLFLQQAALGGDGRRQALIRMVRTYVPLPPQFMDSIGHPAKIFALPPPPPPPPAAFLLKLKVFHISIA